MSLLVKWGSEPWSAGLQPNTHIIPEDVPECADEKQVVCDVCELVLSTLNLYRGDCLGDTLLNTLTRSSLAGR